jgi:hypothetical protein
MFISSYEVLRNEIAGNSLIETGCHLGTRTEFDVANKTAQGFIAFVSCRESDKSYRKYLKGVWFRVVKENEDEKRTAFEDTLTSLNKNEVNSHLIRYSQEDFAAIQGNPWVYWITPKVRNLFINLSKLEDIAQPKQGLATADNFRFLRFWWECHHSTIAKKIKNLEEAQLSKKKWFPYMKGGEYCKWYGNQEFVVNWAFNGDEIKNLGLELGKIA